MRASKEANEIDSIEGVRAHVAHDVQHDIHVVVSDDESVGQFYSTVRQLGLNPEEGDLFRDSNGRLRGWLEL